MANPNHSKRFDVFSAVVGLLLGGAAFWGANKQALGLFHDDGIYTVVAKSLFEGEGYRIISLPTAPTQTKYPFLYSYLVSWVWLFDPTFPHNIIALKSLNIAILVAIFFISIVFYRRHFSESKFAALIFAVIVCTNPIIFTYTDYVISDLLFVLFALIALTICASGSSPAGSRYSVPLLGLVTGLACLTRLAAAPLVLAGSVYAFLHRGWRGVGYFIAVVLLFVAPWLLWVGRGSLPSPNSLFAYYAAYDIGGVGTAETGAWIDRYWIIAAGNARYLAESFELLYLTSLLPGLVLILFVLTVIGAIESLSREELVHWSFFLSSVALLLIWPFHPGRYVAPLVPILLLWLFRGMRTAGQWIEPSAAGASIRTVLAKIAWCPAALILIVNGVWLSSYLLVRNDQSTRGIYGSHMAYSWRGFEESFAWIRQHAPADALLATAYDPMYYLYTGRRAIRPALHRPATYFYPYGKARPDVGSVREIEPQLEKLKVDYLIIDPLDGYAEAKATLKLFDDLVKAYGVKTRRVFTSADGRHKIYELARD